MESPLNSAHFQERRAEAFVNGHQFGEAINCHKKAADYLLEAMKMTQVTQALISLQLQYANHLRQEKILKDKWKRYEVQLEQMRQEHKRRLQEKQQALNNAISSSQIIEKDIINPETDLKNESMITSACSLVISVENFSVSSLNSSTEFCPSKDSKDGATADLNTQVRELQIQVLSLTQALEDSNRENTKLRRTIALMKDLAMERFNLDFDRELEMADNSGDLVIEAETNPIVEGSSGLIENVNCPSLPHSQGSAQIFMNKDGSKVTCIDNDEDDITLPPLETPPQISFEG